MTQRFSLFFSLLVLVLGVFEHAGLAQVQTDLHEAAENGDRNEIEKLISSGANPNEKDPFGRPPINYAARNNHKEAVIVLLKAGSIIVPSGKGTERFAPIGTLDEAILANALDVIPVLLEAGAELGEMTVSNEGVYYFLTSPEGEKAFTLLAERRLGVPQLFNLVFKAVPQGNLHILNKLEKMGADLDFPKGRAFVTAVRYDQPDVLQYLANYGVELSPKMDGVEPLLVAIDSRAIGSLEKLIELGFQPFTGPDPEQRALYIGVLLKDRNFIEAALAKGADINGRLNGISDTSIVFWVIKDKVNSLRLSLSAQREYISLLAEYGADFNSHDRDGNTPLINVMSFNEKEELAEMLLDAGANPCAKNNNGQTPVDYILYYQHTEYLPLLQRAGVSQRTLDAGGDTVWDCPKPNH